MKKLAERAREELGDQLTERQGVSTRKPGSLGPDDERLVW